jgi:hypothetical protein
MTDEIERGAAEDDAGVPMTPTDVDASRTPPSRSSDPEAGQAQQAARRSAEDAHSRAAERGPATAGQVLRRD